MAFSQEFQSTLPARGATREILVISISMPFQSTLPARGATLRRVAGHRIVSISIHAPRTGSDTSTHTTPNCLGNFNPRSPHGERLGINHQQLGACRFQSTLPARGATAVNGKKYATGEISIHAPRTGSDLQGLRTVFARRTISIHAPRTGSDRESEKGFGKATNFNPRSPHGERPSSDSVGALTVNFNPRSPHGERQYILYRAKKCA